MNHERNFFKRNVSPDINSRSHAFFQSTLVMLQNVDELEQKGGGNIVYNKKTMILEHVKSRGFSATGNARDDEKPGNF